jgi:hypothetical protein
LPRASEGDKWASSQADGPTRSEAIRRLVELGLTVKARSAPSERQRAALADVASKAIDSLMVGAPGNDEKASRKRRLIKGSEEFREDRVDLPKVRNPRQSGHRFRRKAATDSDRKRPPNPNEGGHPVDRVRRGALSAI